MPLSSLAGMFLTGLAEPWRTSHRPAGYLMSPQGTARVGGVFVVLFVNDWPLQERKLVMRFVGTVTVWIVNLVQTSESWPQS